MAALTRFRQLSGVWAIPGRSELMVSTRRIFFFSVFVRLMKMWRIQT